MTDLNDMLEQIRYVFILTASLFFIGGVCVGALLSYL